MSVISGEVGFPRTVGASGRRRKVLGRGHPLGAERVQRAGGPLAHRPPGLIGDWVAGRVSFEETKREAEACRRHSRQVYIQDGWR